MAIPESTRRNCVVCGEPFRPEKRDNGYERRHCSRRCGCISRRRRKEARLAAIRSEADRERQVRRELRVVRDLVRREEATSPRPKTCRQCHQSFDAPFTGGGRSGFCSEECRKVRSKALQKRHRGPRKYRERARPGAVVLRGVTRTKVFDRDRYRCQLCKRRTPMHLSGSYEPNAPELDHIIPLALGGNHTWENVQCVCRACNIAKAAKVQGQLRLAI